MEMIALSRVFAILHFSICMPMRFLAGNSHSIGASGYQWSALSMGKAVDALEIAMIAVHDDCTKFLDENFMNSNFDVKFINDRLNGENIESGLYVVATPIGNLSDITIRALSIISSSNLVLCEDTRISKKLTSKYGIKCSMRSFHQHNSKKMIKLTNNPTGI